MVGDTPSPWLGWHHGRGYPPLPGLADVTKRRYPLPLAGHWRHGRGYSPPPGWADDTKGGYPPPPGWADDMKRGYPLWWAYIKADAIFLVSRLTRCSVRWLQATNGVHAAYARENSGKRLWLWAIVENTWDVPIICAVRKKTHLVSWPSRPIAFTFPG